MSIWGSPAVSSADVVIAKSGEARAVIVAPAEIVNAEDAKKPGGIWLNATPEVNRQRLRDSVRDLAHYLGKMSGAEFEVVTDRSAANERIPILIGDMAARRCGAVGKKAPFEQAFRFVVSPEAVGLFGESDLAASYAVYELLHRLGCRWYMPSEMGEFIPRKKTLALEVTDESLAPYTMFRSVWFADNDFGRRNRLGGVRIQMGHALEGFVTKEQREKHPEWQAMNKGKPSGRRLKWSKPGVAEAIADGVIKYLDTYSYMQSVSLSPDDGLGYDDTDDRKLDTGDFDTACQDVSITDRQVWLCNRVIERVLKKHPNVWFGMLAYGQSTRPPLREKPHPRLVPVIAPITYRRAHPMTYDGVPDNEALRYAVEGWAKLCSGVGYYFYGWLLAEPSAPSPFITKWSEDLRYIYDKGNCKVWDPETLATFENTLPALYLGTRMAWDPSQNPDDIIKEVFSNFYGRAAAAMTEYWNFIDQVWTTTPEYSGCGFGHLRRWSPDRLLTARRLMDKGRRAARTPEEKFRIEMADESLKQFELFMKLRRDLANGVFEQLGEESDRYCARATELAEQYQPQYAFCKAGYLGKDATWYTRYFKIFYKKTYDDAARIARDREIVTRAPLRQWRYRTDKERKGEAAGWAKPDFVDTDWGLTDVGIDTWSTIGQHSYMGAMWYRAGVSMPELPAGKKIHLWIGATDGSAKLFINGKHIPYTDAKGARKDLFSGYCTPASFEITDTIQPGGENHIAILCERTFINELGTGGLLAPVVIYREKD